MSNISLYVTGPAKINHVSAKKLPIFSSLQYHNLRTNCTKHNKTSITAAEFNVLSSEIYGNGIPRSEMKIY